ncbi:hypothetical protein KBX71_07710 [Micromonospora sp. D93]|uniref:hypothetical protein n=1 Tax=Micromonospora sp. D93 TaxID=2824886 RepID=UPI001B36582F|nr:hypothetical protein [Micromonospora sp. D93]MBQ1017755.1 hypothetical protein [Micromonospora sp. D93]
MRTEGRRPTSPQAGAEQDKCTMSFTVTTSPATDDTVLTWARALFPSSWDSLPADEQAEVVEVLRANPHAADLVESFEGSQRDRASAQWDMAYICDEECGCESSAAGPVSSWTEEASAAELAWCDAWVPRFDSMTRDEERQALARLRVEPWYQDAQERHPEDASAWPEPDAVTKAATAREKVARMALAATSSNEKAPPGAPPVDPRVPVTLREAASSIWGEREVLARIRQTARARYVGEWALLGAVLAHVACRVGPHVKLPPTIGSAASLNVYIGLVGGSSGGKDAAMDVAAELFAGSPMVVPVLEPATGQGLEAAYTVGTKEGPIQFNDTALFKVSEIGSVSAHASMNASTLMPTLLKMFMAQQLGAAYAGEELRRPVRQHGYRAAIVAGVQPAKSELLLSQDAIDAGTAQRWLFMPVNDDPDRPSRFAMPDSDAAISWRTEGTGAGTLHGWHDRPEWSPSGNQRVGKDIDPVDVKETLIMPICDQAREEITSAQRTRRKLDLYAQAMDSIDGHTLLTQLKVAALLGLLDGRMEVSAEDWRLARLVMGVSRDTRDVCYRVLRTMQSKKNRSKAEGDAEREVAKAEAIEQAEGDREEKTRMKIATRLRHLLAGGDWIGKTVLNQGVAGRDKKIIKLETVLDQMVGTAEIERRTEGRTEQYRLRAR